MSYCDAAWADAYFEIRAFSEKWGKLKSADKGVYLETATSLIKTYCAFEDEQGNIYIYDETTDEVPVWLKRATCEEALHLLNLGKDPVQQLKVHTLGLVRTDDGTTFDKEFVADVLGASCRVILEREGGLLSELASSGAQVSGGYFTK